MKNWPLRWKLTLWSALVTGLALLTFGIGAAITLYFRQIDELDERLETHAKLFFREVHGDAPVSKAHLQRIALLLAASGELRGFAFGPSDGAPEHVSSEKIESLLQKWPPPRKPATVWQEKRFVRIAVFHRGDRTLALVASQKPIQETLSELAGAYFLALPLVLLVVAGGSWWMSRRALQPIVNITRETNAITASQLDRRLHVPPADDEIGQHVRVLNAMFDRLQSSFEQATRFAADASHELRTPLTILRGEIEVALQGGEAGGPQEKLLLSLLEQTSALQKITGNLLLLARFDAGKLPLEFKPVDFSQVVRDGVEDGGMLAGPANITIKADVQDAISIAGDAVLLRRMLLNLIDNAVRYTPPAGKIVLELKREGPWSIFTLRNTGPGIPADRQPAIFQRFFRASDDRNSSTGGSGLGLSLCREIVAAHGGTIELARSDAEWTEFKVMLPAAR